METDLYPVVTYREVREATASQAISVFILGIRIGMRQLRQMLDRRLLG